MLPTLAEWKRICAGVACLIPDYVQEQLYEALKGYQARPVPEGQDVVGHFIKTFQLRLNRRPMIEPMHMKRLKDLAKTNGVERVKSLIDAFFDMKDSEFQAQGYPLSLFLFRISRVAEFMERGQAMTKHEERRVDRRQTTANSFQRLLEKAKKP